MTKDNRPTTTTTLEIHDDKYYIAHPKSYPKGSTLTNSRIFLVTLLSGLLFGAGLQRAQMFAPDIIRSQFQIQSWHMLQTFLFAETFTLFVLALISVEFPQKFAVIRKGVFWDNPQKEIPNMRGPVSAFIGGMILGIGGFAIAGSCPGTLATQLGAGVHNSKYILAGAFAGTFAYGVLHPLFNSWFNSYKTPKTKSVDQYLNLPYHYVAIPFMIITAGVALGLDFITHQPAIRAKHEHLNPIYPGMLISAAQIMSLFGLNKTLGCSTSYKIIISSILNPILPSSIKSLSIFDYFRNANIFASALPWWQVSQLFFMAMAAFITSKITGEYGQYTVGTSQRMAFLGGFLTLFGARLGGGCTSGHGLSGLAKLQNVSFVAVAGMFFGGYLAGYLFLGIANPLDLF